MLLEEAAVGAIGRPTTRRGRLRFIIVGGILVSIGFRVSRILDEETNSARVEASLTALLVVGVIGGAVWFYATTLSRRADAREATLRRLSPSGVMVRIAALDQPRRQVRELQTRLAQRPIGIAYVTPTVLVDADGVSIWRGGEKPVRVLAVPARDIRSIEVGEVLEPVFTYRSLDVLIARPNAETRDEEVLLELPVVHSLFRRVAASDASVLRRQTLGVLGR